LQAPGAGARLARARHRGPRRGTIKRNGYASKERRAASADALYAASLTATACLALTVLVNILPTLDPTLGSRRFHVAIETSAAMALIFVAAVLFGRFRLNNSLRTLLKFAAMFVLAVENLVSVALTIALESTATSFVAWAFAFAGVLGAALLAVAALMPDRPIRHRGGALFLAIGASVAVLTPIVVLTAVFADVLPGAFQEPPATAEALHALTEHSVLIVAEALTAVCYGVAAVAFARQAENRDDEFLKWLSIALVIASAAYLNYTLFPSQFQELLYSGDVFFLAATVALVYAAVREIANEEKAQIRSAVLAERRRVARDLHDGVAQELAFIASQTRWFLRQPTNGQPLELIMDAVERALDESRGAIAALSRPIDEPLDLALGQAAQDVASRVGARLRLDLDAGVDVPAEWRDALLRIAREAVGNAVRHGRARTITMKLRDGEGAGVRLRVSDDGDGFDTEAPRSNLSYGLTSMRERAESLGGQFVISSVRGAGTTIEVILP
jgi:signal transduction histidine kinase